MRLSINEVNVYRYVDENVKCIKNKLAETSIGRHVNKTHTPQCMLAGPLHHLDDDDDVGGEVKARKKEEITSGNLIRHLHVRFFFLLCSWSALPSSCLVSLGPTTAEGSIS